MKKSDIKNLVFKGGGVLGIAYAGALEVLEKEGILHQVQRVAGTSAGAITSALVSLKYSASEIKQVINSTDFKSFEDKWDPLRIATKYGLYKGDSFLMWMQDKITAKGLSPDATFLDFHNAGCLDLRVFATDLNIKNVKMFSFETTPHVVVAEAVRASMSIPMFFEAWQFKDNNPDNHIYVDGGTVFNYPITTFDKENVSENQTLGLFLENLSGAPVVNDLKYDHVVGYVRILFETVLNAQEIDFENDPFLMSRTIRVDSFGMSALDFQLNDDQKLKLYNSGVDCTTKFLNNLSE
jgi:NTE family protein